MRGSKGKRYLSPPTVKQLESELKRESYRRRYNRVLRSTIYMLITVAAVAVLVATLFLPVLRIYGSSMTPTITDGDIVVSLKGNSFARGDIIAFYYNNKILVKRIIAFPGEWVDIDVHGNVSVNDELLDEPYLTEKSLGECDITLPLSSTRWTHIRSWRPPSYLLGQPEQYNWMHSGRTNCWTSCISALATGGSRSSGITAEGEQPMEQKNIHRQALRLIKGSGQRRHWVRGVTAMAAIVVL